VDEQMSARRRMGAAILLSLAAHALVLTIWAVGRPSRIQPTEAGRLTISLQRDGATGGATSESPIQKQPETVATRNVPEQPRHSEHTHPTPPPAPNTVKPEPRPAPRAAIAPIQAPERSPEPPAGRAAAIGKESSETTDKGLPRLAPGARQAVRARLEDELAKHFRYPLLARRRGWEGSVVLHLRIDGSGRIDAMEITETSGHGILDRAALEAVTRISRIPDAAEQLGGAAINLDLPVIYRLSEG
jgi:protein TonB